MGHFFLFYSMIRKGRSRVVVAQTFNPNTQEAEAGGSL